MSDDYFPIGTAPTSEGTRHGAGSLIGASGADTLASSAPALDSAPGGGIICHVLFLFLVTGPGTGQLASREDHRIRRPRDLDRQTALTSG